MTNVTCNDIEGAMYAFPQIKFGEKAMKRAENLKIAPDFMYCMDMLKETGIMTVPGSGFGQREGTYHFRLTNLITPTVEMEKTMITMKKFNEKFHERFD
jgi:alanine transaminase